MINNGRTNLDRLNELPEPLKTMALNDCKHPDRICDSLPFAIHDVASSDNSSMGEWFWRGVSYFIQAMEEDFKEGRITSPKFLEGYNAAASAYGKPSTESMVSVSALEFQLLKLKAQAFDSINSVMKKTNL